MGFQYYICILFVSLFCVNEIASASGDYRNSSQSLLPYAENDFHKGFEPSNNRILIKYKTKKSPRNIRSLTKKHKINHVRALDSATGWHVVSVPEQSEFKSTLARLKQNPGVAFAEPDYEIYLHSLPNDELYDQQWSFDDSNIPDSTGNSINAPAAWDQTLADSSVVIAVIDTGIDYRHEDLINSIWINPGEIADNGVDDDGNGYIDDIYGIDSAANDSNPMDIQGHGTHVSGIIGAESNNGKGIAGVTWGTKILSCKVFSKDRGRLKGFVSDAVECLDYIYNLKVNRGINIIASNNSWGWVGRPSFALKEAIERQMEAGILFVTSAGNWWADTDSLAAYPSVYGIPNILSVGATDADGELASFSNYGPRSVHIVAPGVSILSTYPGKELEEDPETNPFQSHYFNDVEESQDGWTREGSWGLSSTKSLSPDNSWSDSPDEEYKDDVDASLESPVIDLSTANGQELYLAFFATYEIESGFDYLDVEVSDDGGKSWINLGSLTGFQNDWKLSYFPIPNDMYSDNFKMRFRFVSDDYVTFGGVYIDNIGVGVAPDGLDLSSNTYRELGGTSMAAPHVSGVAALLKSQSPSRDWIEIKNLIIAGGKPIESLSEKSISGRLLRAADTDGLGALTCEGQNVYALINPKGDDFTIASGTKINVEILNIECAASLYNILLDIKDSEERVLLKDDGNDGDAVAGDGVFSASLDGSLGASYEIEVDSEVSIKMKHVPGYFLASETQAAFVSIGNTNSIDFDALETGLASFDLPFNINFRDDPEGLKRIAVSNNGYVILYNEGDEAWETPVAELNELLPKYLPVEPLSNLIAPFWDNLYLSSGGVYWAVEGESPNRKLIIEWNNMASFSQGGSYTFQLHFFESRSDIEFWYQNIENFIETTHSGRYTAIGVQAANNHGQTYSFSSSVQNDSNVLIWKLRDSLSDEEQDTTAPDENPEIIVAPSSAKGESGSGGGAMDMIFCLLVILYFSAVMRIRKY